MANDTSDGGGLQNQLEDHYNTFIVSGLALPPSIFFFLPFHLPIVPFHAVMPRSVRHH